MPWETEAAKEVVTSYCGNHWGKRGVGVAHQACESQPRSPPLLLTSSENNQPHTHKFHVGKKKKIMKRLTKLIAYALVFYESRVVEGVPTVQDLRVLADHRDAPQG